DVVLSVEGAVVPALYRHIRDNGLRVGADVAVTAFGQYGVADALRPHLTTVLLPLRKAGALALQHALADEGEEHLLLPGELRVRASTPRRGAVADHACETHTSRTTGIVLPSLTSSLIREVSRYFVESAHQTGRQCVLLTEDTLANSRAAMITSLEGIIAWGSLRARTID